MELPDDTKPASSATAIMVSDGDKEKDKKKKKDKKRKKCSESDDEPVKKKPKATPKKKGSDASAAKPAAKTSSAAGRGRGRGRSFSSPKSDAKQAADIDAAIARVTRELAEVKAMGKQDTEQREDARQRSIAVKKVSWIEDVQFPMP